MNAKEFADSIPLLTGATEEAHGRYLRWHLEKAFEAGRAEVLAALVGMMNLYKHDGDFDRPEWQAAQAAIRKAT